MAQRRSQASVRTVIVPPIFDIPDGLEGMVYDDNYEDVDDQEELEDFIETDKTKKKKKKKKKKKRKKKKRKKGKKKDKDKKKGKKNKDKNRDKDNDGKGKKLNTPSTFEVVKQVIRTKRDGSQVVDLTVDVDRINRADKYEFRITKKDTGKTTVVNG